MRCFSDERKKWRTVLKTRGFLSRERKKYRGKEVFSRRDFNDDGKVSQFRKKEELQRVMERYRKQKITTVYSHRALL